MMDRVPGEAAELTRIHEGFWRADLIPELKTEHLQRVRSDLDRSRALSYRSLAQWPEAQIARMADPLQVAEILGFAAHVYDDADDPHLLWAKMFDLLLSGMAYEAAGLPSSARLLIKGSAKIWYTRFHTRDLDDPLDLLENRTLECALGILSKEPRSANTAAVIGALDGWEETVVALFEQGEYSYGDLVHFTGQALLVQGLHSAAIHLLHPELGVVYDPEFAEGATDIYEHLGDAKHWLFSLLLQRILPSITSASSGHMLLPFYPAPGQAIYVRDMLRRRRIVQLWPSQLAAIEQGALDPNVRRLVLTMPTSAGKTLIAETIIAKNLLEDHHSKCIYLAPTRALVAEVEYGLRRTFRSLGIDVTQVADASLSLMVEAPIAAQSRILCSTPEKLDALLRLESEILHSISLVVIDEGQLLEDVNRGQLLESAIIKLQIRFPHTKIVFLSAVVPNDREIAAWLGAGTHRSESIRSDWRPTQLRIGEAEIEETTAELVAADHVLQAAQNQGKRILRRCLVKYLGGESVDAFYVRYGEASRYQSIRSQVVALARAYEHRGSVLVLGTSRPRVEDIAADLTGVCVQINDEQLQKLAMKIEREIDPEFPLANYVRSGVAYHHGDLPPRIRFQVEKAARDNKLRFTAATTTLAEGVNLPVATLVVDDLMFRYQDTQGNWRRKRMSARKFWNLAGRAGRAGSETEGHVIILRPDRFFDTEEEKLRFLSPRGQRLEPLESVSLKLIRVLQDRYRHLLQFDYEVDPFDGVQPIQTLLLALLDLSDTLEFDQGFEEAVEQIMRHSLICYEGAASDVDRTHFRNLIRWGFSVVRDYDELSYEMRRLIVQLGFPIRTSIRLIERFRENSTEELLQFLEIRQDGAIVEGLLVQLYSAVFDLDELVPSRHGDLPHALLAVEWIKGTGIGALAQSFFQGNDRSLAEASNYLYHAQAFSAAWGIGGLVRLIGFLLVERGAVEDPELLDYEISYLPTYSTFGIGNPVAAQFAARGVERLDAIALSEWFYSDQRLEFGEMVNCSDPIRWLKSIPRGNLEEFITSKRGSFDSDIVQAIADMSEYHNRN